MRPFRIEMRMRFEKIWAALLLLLVATCASRALEPSIILISLDGFRWDYLERGAGPNLNLLAAKGVRARGLIPIFPSKTFPNHYTIVTGLYAESHGIVANNMYDPVFDATFSLSQRDEVGNGRWWGGEPIWVTAARQGVRSAALFWPGSEAEIGGYRPDFWLPYQDEMPYRDRVDQILAWLDLPANQRPRFIAGYFSAVDSAGHRYGPDDPRVLDAIRQVDQAVGWLMQGLRERGLARQVNLIIVADHGMATWVPGQIIRLDDYIDLARVRVTDWDPVAQIIPDPDYLEECVTSLQDAHPALKVYRRELVPERLHFRNNRRIAPVVALGDPGWRIVSREFLKKNTLPEAGGSHGFDNMIEEMQGIFVAQGPAFREGLLVEPFLNIHIYPLMSQILGIEPAPNEGDLERVRHLLKGRP